MLLQGPRGPQKTLPVAQTVVIGTFHVVASYITPFCWWGLCGLHRTKLVSFFKCMRVNMAIPCHTTESVVRHPRSNGLRIIENPRSQIPKGDNIMLY